MAYLSRYKNVLHVVKFKYYFDQLGALFLTWDIILQWICSVI